MPYWARSKMNMQPCFKFAASGKCLKGDRCGYFHDPDVRERFEREEQLRCIREEERALRKQQDFARVDAARTITREVDGCLVTFHAGLSVGAVVSGYDVTRGRIPNLPMNIQVKDLIELFGSHGMTGTVYTLSKPYKADSAFITIASTFIPHLNALPPLKGITLRFVPFRNDLKDDTSGHAFGRTLTVQVIIRSFASDDFSAALRLHLELKALPFGLRGVKKEGTPVNGGSTKVRISLELDSWDHALALRDSLRQDAAFYHEGYRVLLNNIFLPSKHQYPIFLSPAQYKTQKSQWDELTLRCRQSHCDVKVREFPNGKVRVTLFGDDLSFVGPMKVRAEQLARGTIVNMWNRRLFDDTVVEKLTNRLQETTGALMHVDKRLKCLRVYGPSVTVERAREQLQCYAEELASSEYTRDLSSQQVVRFFVEVGYPQLTETYGEEAVTIDLTSSPKRITVTGDEEIRHRLDQLFDDAIKGRMHNTASGRASEDEDDCPICMCPASAPTRLSCGHVYCTQCLTHFVKSSLDSTSFPLTCSADGARCGVPIAIHIFEKFLHAPKLQQLLETAFHVYLEQNPDVLSPCKTPGCTQLFTRDASRANDGEKLAKCPSCFVSACAACGNNPHQGTSCEMAGRDPSEEYINNSPDIRRCPTCQTPIYKDGGCNHISCRCGRHICWRCMEAFGTSELCYAHMRARHGGFFDAEMDAADARRGVQDAPLVFGNIPVAYIQEDAQARALARDAAIARRIGERGTNQWDSTYSARLIISQQKLKLICEDSRKPKGTGWRPSCVSGNSRPRKGAGWRPSRVSRNSRPRKGVGKKRLHSDPAAKVVGVL